MNTTYSAIGSDFKIGPLGRDAMREELQRLGREARPITIILHQDRGDRAGPLEHFPELLSASPLESVPVGDVRYRTLWRRFCAGAIDLVVIAPFVICIAILQPPEFSWLAYSVLTLMSVVNLSYFVICHGRWGQTLGKRVMGVRVVDVRSEEAISLRQSFFRELPFIIITGILLSVDLAVVVVGPEQASLALSILYVRLQPLPNLWAIVDVITAILMPKRRSLHDCIGRTVVVVDGAFAPLRPPPLSPLSTH